MSKINAFEHTIRHPEWSCNATIYEVNIRQFSEEGTFAAFEKYLPELKKMGVKIIWLMPIHPIGELNRKGSLGSYYSVKDYNDINPEFGTKKDFRHLVEKTHELGMYLIIDWVANHAAWDNVWTKTHPEYFEKDRHGNFYAEVSDWTDVIDLNYKNPKLRRAMTDAMKYWVKEFNIDGFRCDVAAMVPTEFWKNVRRELEEIKPVFMLAEADNIDLHQQAFDMTYAWTFKDIMKDIAQGDKNVHDLDKLVIKEFDTYNPDDYRMLFMTNHDENSWNGTAYERFGDATPAFIAFTCVFRGMPLLYNGLEAGMNKALSFFDKDTIPWQDHPNRELYSKLFNLKLRNPALWNGISGGDYRRLKTSDDGDVFAFSRKKDGNQVIAIFNFSHESKTVNIKSQLLNGIYTNVLNDNKITLSSKASINLGKWDFLILEKQ